MEDLHAMEQSKGHLVYKQEVLNSIDHFLIPAVKSEKSIYIKKKGRKSLDDLFNKIFLDLAPQLQGYGLLDLDPPLTSQYLQSRWKTIRDRYVRSKKKSPATWNKAFMQKLSFLDEPTSNEIFINVSEESIEPSTSAITPSEENLLLAHFVDDSDGAFENDHLIASLISDSNETNVDSQMINLTTQEPSTTKAPSTNHAWERRVKSQAEVQKELELQRKLEAERDISRTIGASTSNRDTDFRPNRKRSNPEDKLALESAIGVVKNLIDENLGAKFYADLLHEDLISLGSIDLEKRGFRIIMEILVKWSKK